MKLVLCIILEVVFDYKEVINIESEKLIKFLKILLTIGNNCKYGGGGGHNRSRVWWVDE
jgi:hypothetical protein